MMHSKKAKRAIAAFLLATLGFALSACTPSEIAQVVHNAPHAPLTEDSLGWCEDHGMRTIAGNSGKQDDWYCVTISTAITATAELAQCRKTFTNCRIEREGDDVSVYGG